MPLRFLPCGCRYRLTAGNVTWLRNKNTGDAPGDIGFFLSKFKEVVTCTDGFNTDECFLGLNSQVRKFSVKVDGAWGQSTAHYPLPTSHQTSHRLPAIGPFARPPAPAAQPCRPAAPRRACLRAWPHARCGFARADTPLAAH